MDSLAEDLKRDVMSCNGMQWNGMESLAEDLAVTSERRRAEPFALSVSPPCFFFFREGNPPPCMTECPSSSTFRL